MRPIFALLVALVMAMAAGGCGDDFPYGKTCVNASDCEDGICQAGVLGSLNTNYCTTTCESDGDCGDGFKCQPRANTSSVCVPPEQASGN